MKRLIENNIKYMETHRVDFNLSKIFYPRIQVAYGAVSQSNKLKR